MKPYILDALLFLGALNFGLARKHHLTLENEDRSQISISTFGFLKGGTLLVNVSSLSVYDAKHKPVNSTSNKFGFVIEKTMSSANSLLMDAQGGCALKTLAAKKDANSKSYQAISVAFGTYDVSRYGDQLQEIQICSLENCENSRRRRSVGKENGAAAAAAAADNPATPPPSSAPSDADSKKSKIPKVKGSDKGFRLSVSQEKEEGLYNLYMVNCERRHGIRIDVDVFVVESNKEGNFLSAGEQPLPTLFFIFSFVFFVASIAWLACLRKYQSDVFKIHYLMLSLLYFKSVALVFHGLNYHFIQENGTHEEAWAIMYYITHLLKGALLFITIILIGTGWAFIKHILSKRDKKIFMIVIPLQVLNNVALVIMEETEEGFAEYAFWYKIFYLVDLLCCGAIIFPVVWSIHHLQEASQTDGKAAINLAKLQLFRHFYVMIVCYIYFTRIIVYLLRVTVPFQYEWLDSFFRESANLVFFVVTGYKFRPGCNNPYLRLPADDDQDDLEMEGVVEGESGVVVDVIHRGYKRTRIEEEDEEENEDSVFDRQALLPSVAVKQREISLEFD